MCNVQQSIGFSRKVYVTFMWEAVNKRLNMPFSGEYGAFNNSTLVVPCTLNLQLLVPLLLSTYPPSSHHSPHLPATLFSQFLLISRYSKIIQLPVFSRLPGRDLLLCNRLSACHTAVCGCETPQPCPLTCMNILQKWPRLHHFITGMHKVT